MKPKAGEEYSNVPTDAEDWGSATKMVEKFDKIPEEYAQKKDPEKNADQRMQI